MRREAIDLINPKAKEKKEEKMSAKAAIRPVVSKQFCSPSQAVFTLRRRPCTVTEGGLVAADSQGNEVFRVEGCGPTVKDRALLNDADGTTLLTLRRKALSFHKQWKGYRGDESSEDQKPIFRVISSAFFPEGSPVKVQLASSHRHWDYEIEGSFSERRCTVYDDSHNVVAEVTPNIVPSQDIYSVVVHPGCDQAFILGLVAVLEKLSGEDGA